MRSSFHRWSRSSRVGALVKRENQNHCNRAARVRGKIKHPDKVEIPATALQTWGADFCYQNPVWIQDVNASEVKNQTITPQNKECPSKQVLQWANIIWRIQEILSRYGRFRIAVWILPSATASAAWKDHTLCMWISDVILCWSKVSIGRQRLKICPTRSER